MSGLKPIARRYGDRGPWMVYVPVTADRRHAERMEGDFTFYRPQLVMLVTGPSMSRDEYGATVSWQLQLKEA